MCTWRPLWRARPIERIDGQAVTLEDHDALEVISDCAGRRQAAHAGADDNCLPADVSSHHTFSAGPLKLRDPGFFIASITGSGCISTLVASSS